MIASAQPVSGHLTPSQDSPLRSIGSTVLDQASRRRVNLIVAGGYGHSRLREWAIGGTTRDLFLSSPVPVRFSH